VSSALVFHNTLYNNNRHRDLTGFTGSGNGHKIKNNIVYQTNVDHISLDSSNLVGVDPQFRDAANGDLRLKASSPAIDAGISLPEVRRAINGIRRPQGVASDIGAYEFDTASPGVDIIPPAPPMDLGAF
jgi:hypothetical protein